MSSFSLSDIVAAADAKYASTEIEVHGETVVLVNALQLSKDKRDELGAIQDRMGEDDADQEACLKDALRVVAKNDHQANVLLGAIGDNLAVLVETFEHYGKATQAGEA